MCKSQKDRLGEYSSYINELTETMNKIDNDEDNEINDSNLTDISILKSLLDIDVEEHYLIPKEHKDFRTRRQATLFFNYKKYLQLMNDVGLDNNLRTDVLRQE